MSQSIPFVRSHFFILCSIISVLVDVQCFVQCKGIRDNLGFWIPRCGLRIPGTGFQSLSVELGFWIPIIGAIPDSLSCIPDSKTQDSGFPHMGRNVWCFELNQPRGRRQWKETSFKNKLAFFQTFFQTLSSPSSKLSSLCVYVLHTTSQKEVLRRSRAVVVNTEMY